MSPRLSTLTTYWSSLLFCYLNAAFSILLWFDLLEACCLAYLLNVFKLQWLLSFPESPFGSFSTSEYFCFLKSSFFIGSLASLLSLNSLKMTSFTASFQSFWSLFLQYEWSHCGFSWACLQWEFFLWKAWTFLGFSKSLYVAVSMLQGPYNHHGNMFYTGSCSRFLHFVDIVNLGLISAQHKGLSDVLLRMISPTYGCGPGRVSVFKSVCSFCSLSWS